MVDIINMVVIFNMAHIIKMVSIISMIQMMYIICIINMIIIVCIIDVIRMIINNTPPRSTSFAEFRCASLPRSAKKSCHWKRVDVCLSPHRGPVEYVESSAQEVRRFPACLSKSRNPRRNVTTGHRTVVDTKPPDVVLGGFPPGAGFSLIPIN